MWFLVFWMFWFNFDFVFKNPKPHPKSVFFWIPVSGHVDKMPQKLILIYDLDARKIRTTKTVVRKTLVVLEYF